MKILLTSHRFYPDIGGIESVSELLAHHFTSAGHTVRLITQSGSDSIDTLLFPFEVCRHPSAWQLLASYRWADVVLQNNLEVRKLWPCLLCRTPLVIALHTWIRTAAGERGGVQRLKRLALRAANHVIACSDAIRLDSDPQATVINNPYNNAFFHHIPTIPRGRAIAFLGRLVSDKGADLLLRAFAALPPADWRLSLIGDGPERAALTSLGTELGISDQVDFRGALRGEDLVHTLNQHEIVVVPSRWREPFGVVVLEALACGCVVLASDGGGLPDAVGPAGLLFHRNDLADLTHKLQLLIEDQDLRASLRKEAPGHLAQFEEDLVCSRYLKLLEGTKMRSIPPAD